MYEYDLAALKALGILISSDINKTAIFCLKKSFVNVSIKVSKINRKGKSKYGKNSNEFYDHNVLQHS